MSNSSDEHDEVPPQSPFPATPKNSQSQKSQTYFDQNLFNSTDSLMNTITNLEQRLQTCESVYKLAAESNTIRERERTFNQQLLDQLLKNIDSRIMQIEDTVHELPVTIKQYIMKEFAQRDIKGKVDAIISEFSQQMDEQLSNIESIMQQTDKKNAKNLKKIKLEASILQSSNKNDESVWDDIEQRMNEVKQRQNQINSMIEEIQRSK